MKKKNNKKIIFAMIFLFAVILIAGCGSNAAITQPNQEPSPVKVPETKIVDGVQVATLSWGKLNYEPEIIRLKANVPAKIVADTERLQGCFRSFAVPELGIQKSFNEQDNSLNFMPDKKGTYAFGCSMGMGRGTLIIE